MGQIERDCNGAADGLEIRRRQHRDDILPLGRFHPVQAGQGYGGHHVALGPAPHGGLAWQGVAGQLVVMILQRRGRGRGERDDRHQETVLPVPRDHDDRADLDHFGHDVAGEIAHDDAAWTRLIEQSHTPL